MKKITNSQVFRENIQTKISGILDVPDDSVSINLEKGVFNYALKEATRKKIVKKWENPQFTSIYIDRLRSIYMNLKNDVFLKQIRSGEIDSKNVAFMTHQEFNPEKWRVLIEKKMKRDASKYDDNIQASTDMYTCRKCKSKRCTYYEMQTRSADEPATIFVTCLDCGKHWRS
jgi:transcription elongation factor S-II